MTSARVKAALVHHDVCHRDEDYTGVVRRLRAKLRPVFGAGAEHEILLLTGSGTAAMEMALVVGGAAGQEDPDIANGAFGERLGEIAELHGLPHAAPAPALGRAARSRPRSRRRWRADPDIAAVAMIHHETSVGLLNPVAAIGRAVPRART